jgi:hypothetical protein
MNGKLPAFIVSAVLLFALTCSAFASEGAARQHRPQPVFSHTTYAERTFGIQFMPGVPVSELEWDLELKYAVIDVPGVFDHYDWELSRLGFNRSSYKPSRGEIKAKYFRGGIEASLEVESGGGRTEVELELKGRSPNSGRGESMFAETGGIILPFFAAEISRIEWKVDFRHVTTDVEGVFRFYDQGLLQQGWRRTKIDRDDDEIEANYVNAGLRLELEVERKGRQVRVEFELKD